MENVAVLADAQFGLARILRPYEDFEDDYQGVVATTPIMVTEKGRPRDKLASEGVPGYDPNLVRGVSTPVGARVLLWLPVIGMTAQTPTPYRWTFYWRFRNVYDNRQAQLPFHYPKQSAGVADSSAVQPRVVIPACNQSIVYTQAEPAGTLARVTQNLRTEDLNVGTTSLALPLLPGGTTGVIQQGLLDPGTYPTLAPRPLYQVHELQAAGDELLVGVSRDTQEATPNWGFAQGETDENLSILLGDGGVQPFEDIGVYVLVGSAP